MGQGVYAWNAWREKNESIIPRLICVNLLGADLVGVDLVRAEMPRGNFSRARLVGANLSGAMASGADLSRAELTGAKLRGTVLKGGNLSGADLGMADLSGANLAYADLSGANLVHANLTGANLLEAKLGGANLSGADLTGANLLHADLAGANLGLAVLSQTILAAVDLRTVRGLETCQHLGPSVVDHWTLAKSGLLPVAFLRACGLSDDLIAQGRAPADLQGRGGGRQTVQTYACYIVHARSDDEFAAQLHADLQGAGLRAWLAPQDDKPGVKFRSAPEEASGSWERGVLVISEACKGSDWLVKYVKSAVALETAQQSRLLFPVHTDDCLGNLPKGPLVPLRETREFVDFRDWRNAVSYWRTLQPFIGTLRAACGPRGPGAYS